MDKRNFCALRFLAAGLTAAALVLVIMLVSMAVRTGSYAAEAAPLRPVVPEDASRFSLAKAAPVVTSSLYLPILSDGVSDDWLQFGFDARHSGNNTLETRISAANVGSLQLKYRTLLRDVADSAPVYLNRVATPGGVRDLIFITTRTGTIQALDARTGSEVWWRAHGANGCLINNNQSRNETCYTTSSPAIDPNRQFVYSYGLDGYVHKFAVGDGTEVLSGGWPELISLKVYDEKGSSSLATATDASGQSYLYAATAGYPGDEGDYQGHVVAINLATGAQRVFNMLCSNQAVHFVDSRVTSGPDCSQPQSGVWARPGVIYDSDNNRIYAATGNAMFSPASFMWGDTVLALHPDGSGAGGGVPVDSYTPANQEFLWLQDLDLGSTAPAILPPAPGKHPHLAMQAGKDAVLRLIDLDNLSGQSRPGILGGEVFSMTAPSPAEIPFQPAVWVDPADGSTWIFVTSLVGLDALQLAVDAGGNPSLVARWSDPPGSSPIVANGVLYFSKHTAVYALDPHNGQVLWSGPGILGLHWQSPIVAHGVLYMEDLTGHLSAYGLP